jgi:hypothetical protein
MSIVNCTKVTATRYFMAVLSLTDLDTAVVTVVVRWDEKAGLRRDAVGSQVIDVLKAQIKETGNEEG